MSICNNCLNQGYCRCIKTRLVAEVTIRDRAYLAALRAFMMRYSYVHKVTPENWLEHLADLYRDYPGWIEGDGGEEVFLDLEILDIPSRREWFRDFIGILPDGVRPRVRKESVERIRTVATVLTACFPAQAALWGRGAANDNQHGDAAHDIPAKDCLRR